MKLWRENNQKRHKEILELSVNQGKTFCFLAILFNLFYLILFKLRTSIVLLLLEQIN